MGSLLAGIGIYITHIFLISVDFYISIKRLMINDPLISKNKAISLSATTWIIWIAVGAMGFVFANPVWSGTYDKCIYSRGVHAMAYNVTLMSAYTSLGTATIVLHILTIRVLLKSMEMQFLHQNGKGSTPVEAESDISIRFAPVSTCRRQPNSHQAGHNKKRAKYLQDRQRLLNIMNIKVVIMAVSWGLAVTVNCVIMLCPSCKDAIPVDVLPCMVQMPIVLPILCEGIIYVVRYSDMKKVIVMCFTCSTPAALN
jgi:hypothetical protein